jgi:hypothetical protein
MLCFEYVYVSFSCHVCLSVRPAGPASIQSRCTGGVTGKILCGHCKAAVNGQRSNKGSRHARYENGQEATETNHVKQKLFDSSDVGPGLPGPFSSHGHGANIYAAANGSGTTSTSTALSSSSSSALVCDALPYSAVLKTALLLNACRHREMLFQSHHRLVQFIRLAAGRVDVM